LGKEATAAARSRQESYVVRLASFFPTATPVRIPVQLTRVETGQVLSENTIIEFGTSREVLFACTGRLEFADKIRLQNADGSLDVEATVVALQYHEGQTAVAARFTRALPNWIVKP
jgi:hypothetical protein